LRTLLARRHGPVWLCTPGSWKQPSIAPGEGEPAIVSVCECDRKARRRCRAGQPSRTGCAVSLAPPPLSHGSFRPRSTEKLKGLLMQASDAREAPDGSVRAVQRRGAGAAMAVHPDAVCDALSKETLLHVACRAGRLAAVKELLRHGCNVVLIDVRPRASKRVRARWRQRASGAGIAVRVRWLRAQGSGQLCPRHSARGPAPSPPRFAWQSAGPEPGRRGVLRR